MKIRFRLLFLLLMVLQYSVASELSKDLKSHLYVEKEDSDWKVPDSNTNFEVAAISLPKIQLNPFFNFSSSSRVDVLINNKLVFRGKHKQPSLFSHKLNPIDSVVLLHFYHLVTIQDFKASVSSIEMNNQDLSVDKKVPMMSMLSWACLAVLLLSCLARIYDQTLFFDMFNFTKPLTKETESDFLDLFTGRLPPIFLLLIFSQAFAGFAALVLCFPDSWQVLNKIVLIENDFTEWIVVFGTSASSILGIYIWIIVVSFLFGQKEKVRFLNLNLEIKTFYFFSLFFSSIVLINEINHFISNDLFLKYLQYAFTLFIMFKGVFMAKAFSKIKPGISATRICYICTANLVPLFVIFQYLKTH